MLSFDIISSVPKAWVNWIWHGSITADANGNAITYSTLQPSCSCWLAIWQPMCGLGPGAGGDAADIKMASIVLFQGIKLTKGWRDEPRNDTVNVQPNKSRRKWWTTMDSSDTQTRGAMSLNCPFQFFSHKFYTYFQLETAVRHEAWKSLAFTRFSCNKLKLLCSRTFYQWLSRNIVALALNTCSLSINSFFFTLWRLNMSSGVARVL